MLEGTMNILVGKTWTRAPKGSFLVIPGATLHTFDNPGRTRAGMLSLSIPGGFEDSMPGIQGWFLENPPGKARATTAATRLLRLVHAHVVDEHLLRERARRVGRARPAPAGE